jgi:hypothetical protein
MSKPNKTAKKHNRRPLIAALIFTAAALLVMSTSGFARQDLPLGLSLAEEILPVSDRSFIKAPLLSAGKEQCLSKKVDDPSSTAYIIRCDDSDGRVVVVTNL